MLPSHQSRDEIKAEALICLAPLQVLYQSVEAGLVSLRDLGEVREDHIDERILASLDRRRVGARTEYHILQLRHVY